MVQRFLTPVPGRMVVWSPRSRKSRLAGKEVMGGGDNELNLAYLESEGLGS